MSKIYVFFDISSINRVYGRSQVSTYRVNTYMIKKNFKPLSGHMNILFYCSWCNLIQWLRPQQFLGFTHRFVLL